MPAVATAARSVAFTSTQLCPIASLGSLPLWCSVTVISLQVAGALSSGLSYCIRSLPLISSLHGSAACAYGTAASAPSRAAVARGLRIKVMASSDQGARSVRHSQTLMHHRTGGGVLQELFLLRIQMMLDRERGQCRLVEPGQDQLLLSRVAVDVTHREYSGQAGLELLSVDGERLLFQRQSPLRNRSELRVQPEKHQQLIGCQRLERAVGGADVDTAQPPVIDDQRVRQRLDAAHARGRHLLLHAGDPGGRGAEFVPAMHQHQARGPGQQLERPVERRVATAEDHQMLARQLGRALHPVLDGAAFESVRALESDPPRLKGADAGRNPYGAGVEADAARGAQVKAPGFAPRELHHFVAEVQLRFEGPDLLHEPVDQFLAAANL